MSTSGLDLYNSNVTNLNLIVKNFTGEILCCQTLDNSSYQLSNIEDLFDNELVKDLINDFVIQDIELEQQYLIRLIPRYCKKYSKGIINWLYDYNSLSFKKMNRLVTDIPITLIINLAPYGIGSPETMISSFINLIEKISGIYSYFKEFVTRKKAYVFFEDNYMISKAVLQGVIRQEYNWKKGFIDSNIYAKKDKYEKKIMKDLGYKYNKKAKEWYFQ